MLFRSSLDYNGAVWVRKYALAKSRYRYGEILAKFGGAIPGPLKDLALDQQKRDKAEKEITDLEEQLRLSADNAAISID